MNNNLEIIELEAERIAQLFAQARSIKIKIYFGRTGDKHFPRSTNDPRRGFCSTDKILGRYEIYIRLDRDSRALIFRTLAHELAHAWKRELEGKNYLVKHNTLFWKIMDEETLPFVEENLPEPDRTNLLKLLNPTTNVDENTDRVFLDNKETKLIFLIGKENIDRAWKLVRGETIKGNLGAEVRVSTARKDKDKYKITIYVREGEEARLLVRKLQNQGFKYEEFKTVKDI